MSFGHINQYTSNDLTKVNSHGLYWSMIDFLQVSLKMSSIPNFPSNFNLFYL